MKPRYTDKRYPHGYRMSHDTDIRETFRRVRRQQEQAADQEAANRAEAAAKVEQFPKRKIAK